MDSFLDPISDHPDEIEMAHRMKTEPPRTRAYSTPFMDKPIEELDTLVKGFLAPSRDSGVVAQLLMQYMKFRGPDGPATSCWSAVVLMDFEGRTALEVNNAVVSTRELVLMFGLSQGTNPHLVKCLANMCGIAYPGGIGQVASDMEMRQYRLAQQGSLVVTHIDMYWYAHYADLDPQVHHTQLCELPTAEEAAASYRRYLRDAQG